MQSHINKWGNSAAVRIPASMLASMKLEVNSEVTIEILDGKIVIEPVRVQKNRLKLPFSEEMLLKDLNAHTAHADEIAVLSRAEFGDE